MRIILVVFTIVAIACMTSIPASANPATLPAHPGYPMGKAIDPVSGQSLANDPGRSNAIGDKALMQSAAFDDVHVTQSPSFQAGDQPAQDRMNVQSGSTSRETQTKKDQH